MTKVRGPEAAAKAAVTVADAGKLSAQLPVGDKTADSVGMRWLDAGPGFIAGAGAKRGQR